VKRCLHQADSRKTPFAGAIQHSLHELPPNAPILRLRIDGDRPNPRDGRAFIHAVAADNAPIGFRDHAVETRMRKEHPHKTNAGLGRRKIVGEIVLAGNGREGLVANVAANIGVARRCAANLDG